MNAELDRREETSVIHEHMDQSQVVEKIQQKKTIEKNMQEQQGKRAMCWSPWSGSEFSGFEDDQEEKRINEKCKKLKSWIDIYDNVSSSNGSDIDFSTNDRDEESAASENLYTFAGISFAEGQDNNGNKYTPMTMIRCKSINDLLENSNSVINHINDKQTTTNINSKFSQNKKLLALSKISQDTIVPNKDHIAFIRSEKSVATSSDVAKSHLTVTNSTIGNSCTIPNQRTSHVSSKFNRKTAIPNILNPDRQFPTPPMMSMYNNHPMSIMNMNPPPFMYDAMLSCNNYMPQGMNSSMGMNSFPVPDPLNKSQPPTSFIFNNFNSPITLSQFPKEMMDTNPFRISSSSSPPVISMNGGSNLMPSIGSVGYSTNTPITNPSTSSTHPNNVNSYIGHNLSIVASDNQKYAYKRKRNDSLSFPSPPDSKKSKYSSIVANDNHKYAYERINNESLSSSIPHDSQKSKCSSTTLGFACKYCSYNFVNQELFNKHFQDGLCSRLVPKTGNNDKTIIAKSEHDKEKINFAKRVLYSCYICDKSFDENKLSLHLAEIHNIHHSIIRHYISVQKNSQNYHNTSVLSNTDNINQNVLENISIVPAIKEEPSVTPIFIENNQMTKRSSLNNNNVVSGTPIVETCISNATTVEQRNCSRYVAKSLVQPKASTSVVNSSLSTKSTSSCNFTPDSSRIQVNKFKSTCSPSLITSSQSQPITSNVIEFSSHESNQQIAKDKTACNVATAEDNTGSSINCPGCSFTFMGDDLFSQHLKAGLCSKLLTDIMSKKFTGYTVCNIKKKEINKSTEKQNVSSEKQNVSSEKQNESSEKQNVSSEKQNVSSEKQKVSYGKQMVSSKKQNVSSDKPNASSEKNVSYIAKQNVSTGKQNLSSEKQNLSIGKQSLSSEKQNVSTEKQNASTEKKNVSTGNQNLISEKQNLLSEKQNLLYEKQNEKQNILIKKQNATGKHKVSSEKQNILSEMQNVISEKQNVSSEKQNVLSEKQNVSTGKQNLLSEKQHLSFEKQNVSTRKQNVLSEKQNVSSEKQKISSEKQNVSSEKHDILSKDLNVPYKMQNVLSVSSEKQNESSEYEDVLFVCQKLSSEKKNVSSVKQNVSSEKPNLSSEKHNILSKKLNLSSKMQNVSSVSSEKQNESSEYKNVLFIWQKVSSEKQNVSSEKQNGCLKKQTNKEMLLTHRKTTHKKPNLYPIPTILTEKALPNKSHDKEVTNDLLHYQPNHPKTQTFTSTPEIVFESHSQSGILHNVNDRIVPQSSSVTETASSTNSNTIITIPTSSNSESNISDSGNCVSNNISLEESHQDVHKSPLKSESHELDLQVKRMELDAWKSWKEACDLQVQFWRGKIASQKEASHKKTAETQLETQRNTLVDINNFNLKQEEDPL